MLCCNDCSEPFISETSHMQKRLIIYMLTKSYITVICNKLCMVSVVQRRKAVLMYELWMVSDKCLYKSAYQSNGMQAWIIKTSMYRTNTRCGYNYKILNVYHKVTVLYFKC